MRVENSLMLKVVIFFVLFFLGTSHSRGESLTMPRQANASAYANYSFACIIPYVTQADNTHTNIGINNFSNVSLTQGNNPSAQILVELFDSQGNLKNSATYTVNSNQMSQINNIVENSNLGQDTGWVRIWSTEPISAWASVIYNDTTDSAIELGVPLNPAWEMEGTATSTSYRTGRLMIASSVKTDSWQSSLVVTNASWSTGGNFQVTFYDNLGQVIRSETHSIPANGMYVNPDIRSEFPGTYGPIIIEPQTTGLMLTACSTVKNPSAHYASFFTAQTIPPANTMNIGGVWEGDIPMSNSGIIHAKMTLYQNKSMVFGYGLMNGGPYSNTQYTMGGVLSGTIAQLCAFVTDVSQLQTGVAYILADFKSGTMNGFYLGGSKTDYGYGYFNFTRTGNSFAQLP